MPRGKSILSISELERMLNDNKSSLQRLRKQRAEAQRKVDAIDREMARLDGGAGGRRGGAGGRARNELSLVAAIQNVLKKKEPMGVGDIVDGVQALGYRSSSANFRGIVNQTLIKEKKHFTSPGRGMYQLKK
jgi:hypothetical protein